MPLRQGMNSGGKFAAICADKRLVMVLGSGGVGKTTTSIAIACMAARQGKRVALLSIDPAKRLASALGIPLGSDLHPVIVPELRLTGSLHATMLDQKAVFDQLVAKFAVSPKVAQAIYANRLYQAASTNLGGPLEYLALAKLAIIDDSKQFDLIVVDTPPDTQALDFLQRPNLLNGFVENKVIGWMLKPFLVARKFGLNKLLSVGEKLMGSIAAVTGVQALEALAEFLVLIQDVIDGFQGSGQKVVTMLKRPDTALILVGAPTPASLRSLKSMANEVLEMGYGMTGILVNRLLPKSIVRTIAEQTSLENSAMPTALLQILSKRHEAEQKMIKFLRQHLESIASAVAIYENPEMLEDMQSVRGLSAYIASLESI